MLFWGRRDSDVRREPYLLGIYEDEAYSRLVFQVLSGIKIGHRVWRGDQDPLSGSL